MEGTGSTSSTLQLPAPANLLTLSLTTWLKRLTLSYTVAGRIRLYFTLHFSKFPMRDLASKWGLTITST